MSSNVGENNQNNSNSRFSKEDRRLLISKLIEKKRQSRSGAGGGGDQASGQQYIDDSEVVFEPRHSHTSQHSHDSRTPLSAGVLGSPEREEEEEEYVPDARRRAVVSSANTQTRVRPQSAGRMQRQPSAMTSSYNNPYVSRDDSHAQIDLRTQRVAQAEASYRAENFKECTFHPEIKELPRSYGGLKEKDSPFLARVTRWQAQKVSEFERRKSMNAQAEVQECTFRPKINRNSSKVVKLNRENIKEDDTNLRLYSTYEAKTTDRNMYIQNEQQREQEKDEQECTFQPHLSVKKSKFKYVTAKYDKEKVVTEDRLADERYDKELTFTPKVKGVRKSMSSARHYVSTDVVERLTRPIQAPAQDDSNRHFDSNQYGDRPVMDVASFMGTLGGNTPNTSRRSSSAPRDGQRRNESMTDQERAERNQNFQNFLGRQEQSLMRKERKMEEVLHQTSASFRPQIDEKSMKIANKTRRGEFLERVEMDNQRREKSEIDLVARSVDPECSFKPTLTERALRQRSRSVYELSRGDMHKKETNQRILTLKTEQEQLSELTFQPQISAAGEKAKSSLQLNSNPGGFLLKHNENYKRTLNAESVRQQQRETEELKDCTFTPKTKDCPAYIKRIARSLSVVRNSRQSDAPPVKPQWK